MKFSYKLQELRKGSGMSQEEFAELLGVSRQSVSKWESGKGYPEIDKLIFISNYFNTSLDLLLKDTSDYDSNPSIKSSKDSKKTKHTISLTKPIDTNDSFNNQPNYVSDPLPNKKKDYPLQRVSVSHNTNVRPVKNYKFGNKKHSNKLSKLGVMLTSFIGALIVSSVIVSSVASSQDTEIYEVTEAIYDDDGDMYYDDSYYPNDWRELYDNSMNSDVETQMLLDIGNQSQSLLIDNNDNVYYSGYEVVSTYIEAQYQMRDELNCMELYQEYVFLQNDDSNFIEVYSYDFSNWVIINKDMLQVYLEQDLNDDYIIDCDVPSYEDCDILSLSTSAQAYDDYNNAPFVYAFRLNKQSKAKVSRDIIDLCLEAMQERMYSLPMAYYVPMYEEYNHQYELVSCSKLDTPNGRDITFVPKDFIMVNVSDLEENQELEASENIEENENFEESIIEDNHHNEIHEEDYGDVIEETYFN